MLKKIMLLLSTGFFLINGLFAQSNLNKFFNDTDVFLKKYVQKGRIDYESIKNNSSLLDKLVDDISGIKFSELQKGNQEKAYLINVYNILVIKSVLQYYPLKSVMDIGGFFDNDIIRIGEENYSLNEIEKEILFKKYPDARLHFVLVCAAIGCPQIISEAYMPDKLEEQLNQRTKITLNDDQYVKIDANSKMVFISELFKWYEKDYTKDGMSVLEYINQYSSEKIPSAYKISFIAYDWKLNNLVKKTKSIKSKKKSNLQAYTPSTLLRPGQVEIKLFNNLYSQTAGFNENGKKESYTTRGSYFTAIINSLYGITHDFNVGIDAYIKSVRIDEKSSSPFSLFKFSSDPNSRTSFAHIGPKIKISPFKSLRNLAIQSTFLVALDSDLDDSKNNKALYLDVDGSQWWTQIFYDFSLNRDFLLYFETGFFLRFGAEEQKIYTPLKAFVNYYPSRDWTIYFPLEFTSFWHESSIAAYYSQTGLGGKYQLTSNFELELLFTKFIFGKSQGAGATYNLGVRYIM